MQTPFFPVSLDDDGSPSRDLPPAHAVDVVAIGEATVRHIPLPHPQESTAFRVDERGKSIVFATDTEHAPDHINESLAELARGADVLIYDAQYTTEEYKRRQAGLGPQHLRRGRQARPRPPASRSSSSTATTPATTTRCCARSRPPPPSRAPRHRSPPATACASSCEPRARAVSRAPAL
jgi:hypothetical protein